MSSLSQFTGPAETSVKSVFTQSLNIVKVTDMQPSSYSMANRYVLPGVLTFFFFFFNFQTQIHFQMRELSF